MIAQILVYYFGELQFLRQADQQWDIVYSFVRYV